MNKQMPSKTSTSLRYTTPVGNYRLAAQFLTWPINVTLCI